MPKDRKFRKRPNTFAQTKPPSAVSACKSAEDHTYRCRYLFPMAFTRYGLGDIGPSAQILDHRQPGMLFSGREIAGSDRWVILRATPLAEGSSFWRCNCSVLQNDRDTKLDGFALGLHVFRR